MSVSETCLSQGEGVKPQLAALDTTQDATDGESIMLLEPRPFRPFKTSEEYLYAMKEDLAEWLNNLYSMDINVDNFFERLDTGEVLCAHANNVRRLAEEQRRQHQDQHHQQQQGGGRRFSSKWEIPQYDVVYRQDVTPGSFFARDNVHNFISWCRELGIYEVLLFETDDLVLRKNEKHVILSLLEVARRGARFGMAAPLLVQMEADIDRELEQERLAEERMAESGGQFNGEDESWSHDGHDLTPPEPPKMFYGPQPQIITNDLKSLDEMVRDLVERCSCPSQFPMVKVSEGKYRIGDTRVLIFVRILRNHVMVRVGGGWDTLEHYLDKHDPCRCRQGHRVAVGSRVGFKTSSGGLERQLMNVTYERFRKRSAGTQIMSVRSLSDRVTLQQDTPKLTSPVHKGRDKTAKSHTSTSSLLEKLPNQEIADKGRTASLSNVIIQTETDNLGETDKCENVEQAIFNQQLTLTSQKAGVQISNSSEEKMLNETASLQPVQKDMKIIPSKGSHIMPQHSIQRLKVSSERSRSSSLPIINEAIGQTIRSRTATLDPLECHSRGKYLAKKATDIIHPEIDSKQTSTEKPFGYLQKCREEIKLEDKTKKTTLNWIEKKNLHTSGEYMKPAREELKDSLSVPATTDILGQKPESSQVICPTTKPQTLLFKDEMKTGVSQRSQVSKIPKTLQKANSETSQDLTKNKNAQVSVGNKMLQPPQVNTSSLSSPKKGKLPISSRKGSIKHSLRKDIVHSSPKMEMQGMPRSKGNLHNSQCEPNQSIKPGQSQNSPDKKCSPCSPKKRLPHLSPNKAASKHFPTDGIRITQNKPDSKIPIHIHSPTEAASQKSSKEFLQNVSQGTSSLLSKKGPSPHRGIPVPSTRISHQSHNNISTNRSTPETLSNPAPTLNKDVQHELQQNNASQDSEDKCIYHGQVKNILEESPTRLIKQYSKENLTVFLSSDVDKLQLTVDSEVGATQQDSGGRDTGKVTSTVPTEDLINQNIESESFHLNVSQILTDEGLSQELKDSNKPFLLSQSIQPKPSVY